MIKLGIAPIGWTNDDMPESGGNITFEQCNSKMALAGYIGCEVGNKYPIDARPLLKKQLGLRGLTICNQWFSYEFTTKSFEEVKENFIKHLDFLKYFGAKVVHDSNYKGWILVKAEQDPSIAIPFEYAKKGYEYLTNELKF